LDAIPLGNKGRAAGRIGYEIEQDAHIVSVREHLSYIHPVDKALEPLQRLHQCFGAVKRTDRAAKRQIVAKELSRSDKIAAAHRLLEGCNDVACVGHRSNALADVDDPEIAVAVEGWPF